MRRIALAALVLLTSCSAPVSDAPPVTTTVTATTTTRTTVTATPTTTTEIQPASLEDLRDQLVSAGLRCESWKVLAAGTSGQCDELTLMSWVADTDAGRDFHRAAVNLALTTMANRPDVSLLVGSRWTLRIGTVDAYAVQKLVGGTVLGASSP